MQPLESPVTLAAEDLLARYAAGDDAAFAELVRRHRPLIYSVCARVLGRSADADDATQLVFLALLRKSERIPPRFNLPGWLHQTALYISLRLRQARQLRQQRERAAAPRAALALKDDDTQEWEQTRRVLLQELHALPARYRLPLLLHYCEGLSQNGVAKRLGIKYGTVSGRLNRARALLKERLVSRGIALPVAIVAVLLPNALSAEEAAEPAVHATVGVPPRAEPGCGGVSHIVTQLGLHIYAPVCMVLTLCWFTALLRQHGLF